MEAYVSICGVKPPDKEYKKKLKAFKALKEAGIDVPEELEEYFGYQESPIEGGMEVEVPYSSEEVYNGDYYDDVYTIDLKDVPKDVKQIKIKKYYS